MLLLTIMGWMFVVVPFVAYLAFSFWMVKEIAKDDSSIKSFFFLMFVFFALGVGMLGLAYGSQWLLP